MRFRSSCLPSDFQFQSCRLYSVCQNSVINVITKICSVSVSPNPSIIGNNPRYKIFPNDTHHSRFLTRIRSVPSDCQPFVSRQIHGVSISVCRQFRRIDNCIYYCLMLLSAITLVIDNVFCYKFLRSRDLL